MKKLFLLLSIVFLLTNCKQPDQISYNETIISIRKGDNFPTMKLTDLFNRIELIPLETSPESLLRNTYQIAIHDDRIFIMDYPASKGVKVFSTSGKHIRTIGTQGKGPEEYVRLSNFSTLPSEERIFLTDPNGQKNLVYDWDGNYYYDIPIHWATNEVTFIDTDRFYKYHLDGYYLHLIDVSNQDTTHFIPHTNGFHGTLRAFYPGVDGNTLFSPAYHDSVYTLGRDSLTLKYAFDFGPHKVSGEDIMAEIKRSGLPRTPPNRIFASGNYGDFKNFFVFDIFRENMEKRYFQQAMIYDKTNSNISILDDSSDDILFSQIVRPYYITADNKWVCTVSPLDLKEHLKQIEKGPFSYPDDIVSQIREMKESDNPVVVVFHFK